MVPRGDECVTRKSLYTRTEQPGRFSYTSSRECPAPSPALPWPVPTPALTGRLGAGWEPGLSHVLPVPTDRGSKHDIRVVETNYNEYALVATQIDKGTSSSTMVLLYSAFALQPPCCPPTTTPGLPGKSSAGDPFHWRRAACSSQAGMTHGMAGWGSPSGGTWPLLGCLSPGAA